MPTHLPTHRSRPSRSRSRLLVAVGVPAVTLAAVGVGALHADASTARSDAASISEVARVLPATRVEPVERVRPATLLTRKPVRSVPVAESNATETVAAAEASSYNVPGQCLGWTREQADIPSLYDDAASAWEHASDRHVGDTTPPKGAAVYWLGGSSGHGHVAISLGNGRVRSSDAGGYGVVGTIQLQRLTREWGLEYAGWSDSINGYRIPGVADA